MISASEKAQKSDLNSNLQGGGLALIMSGYMYAWTIGEAVGLSSFVGIGFFFILGMALIVFMSTRKTVSTLFLSLFNNTAAYLMFGVILLLSIISSGANSKDPAWVLFGLGLFISVSFIEVKDGHQFCVGFFWVSALAAVLYLLGVQGSLLGAIQYGDSGRVNLSEDNTAFTLVAYAGGFAAVSALHAIANRMINPIVCGIVFIGGVLTFIMAGTRSIYLGIFLAVLFIVIKGKLDKKQLYNLFLTGMLLLIAVCGLYFSGVLEERLNATFEAIMNAAKTILGVSTLQIDDAANGRIIQREKAISLIWENLAFGAGFKAFWVDFPLLQAFSDLGVFFGLLYLSVVFIGPVFTCFTLRQPKPTEALLCALYMLNLPRLFLHGQPYDWPIFCFAFLPYVVTVNQRWASLIKSPNRVGG